MKKIALISAIVMGSLIYNTAQAQVSIRVGFHFGPRPVPVYAAPAAVEYVEPANYEGDEDYYYLPEVDAYYSIHEQCYYYNNGGHWITAAYLPGVYHDFNWRTARRYEVRAPRPYMHNEYYKTRYNGVAFNGRWNERSINHNGYAYHNNGNYNRGNSYNHQNTRNRGNDHQTNRNHNMGSAQQHFAENMPQRNNRNDQRSHRSARF